MVTLSTIQNPQIQNEGLEIAEVGLPYGYHWPLNFKIKQANGSSNGRKRDHIFEKSCKIQLRGSKLNLRRA